MAQRDDMAGATSGGGGSPALSIETGFSCNAYCAFCPQISYRDVPHPDVPLDLDTQEIRRRIRHGAERGYKQIGLSGGEVTIRQDLVELIGYAKSLGYELIAITTNGMMLGYPWYAVKLVQAGLSSVNISVFGHEARLHDALMRTPGAFDMAMKAIDNIRAIRERTGRRIEMMSMCIAAPQVIDHFPAHVELMGQKGIKLHMLQPFLMTKGNTRTVRQYMTTYDRIERAIREAAKVARKHGGHIKLFNTPVCSFWDIEADLERQRRKLDVFREHRTDRPEQTQRSMTQGYYRVAACATCDEPCPGFRAEYYPQADMAAEVCAAIDRHVALHGAGEVWLAGLELMTLDTMRAVAQHARERGAGRIVVLTAGIGRAYHEQYDRSMMELIDELCFVVHPPRRDAQAFGDRHTSHGNLEDIGTAMETLGTAGARPALSAMIMLEELVGAPETAARLDAWGLSSLGVFAMREDGERGPWWEQPARARPAHELAARGFGVRVLGRRAGAGAGFPVVDPTPRLVRHRWASQEFDWINWSVPRWAHDEQLLGVAPAHVRLPVAASG